MGNMNCWEERIDKAIEYAKTGAINVYNWNETIQKYTVVAFGLGKFFEDTHERLFDMCNVEYVSDNSEEKLSLGEVHGKKCIHPNDIKKLENPFVIAVVGYYSPIRNQMREMGIPVMNITEMHFSEYLKGAKLDWLTDSRKDISRCLELLYDDASRDVFVNVFCNKIYGSTTENDYEQFVEQGEYFQNGIWELQDNEIFVDCGAYIGDTIDDFVKQTNSRFKKIYTFELSEENYICLLQNIEKLDCRDRIQAYHAGVWNTEDQMTYYHFGALDGCQIIENMNDCDAQIARLIALDDIIPEDECVTTLKMDIEGAEQKAIDGAHRIICKDKPKLALCLYHRPEDLWEIPIKIKELNPEYKVCMKHHCNQNYTDTIMYCC